MAKLCPAQFKLVAKKDKLLVRKINFVPLERITCSQVVLVMVGWLALRVEVISL